MFRSRDPKVNKRRSFVHFIISHPVICLIAYIIGCLLIWTHLFHSKFLTIEQTIPMETPLSKQIDSMFQSEPFSLHRITKLGHWLEIIARPSETSSSFIKAITEVQNINRIITNYQTSENFTLNDICIKDMLNKCSIEGNYILDERFVEDLNFDDVQFSPSGYYSHPRSGLPSYGPYMFGTHLNLSKYNTINNVNAVRFRYNIQDKFKDNIWFNEIEKILDNYQFEFVIVSYGSSHSIPKYIHAQLYQSIPFFLCSLIFLIVGSFVCLVYSFRCKKLKSFVLMAFVGVMNLTIPLTAIGLLNMIKYRLTMSSVFACISLKVMAQISFISFFQMTKRPDNRRESLSKIYRKYSFILLRCIIMAFVMSVIIGSISKIPDVKSVCAIIATGSLLIGIQSSLVYLPIATFLTDSDCSNTNYTSRIFLFILRQWTSNTVIYTSFYILILIICSVSIGRSLRLYKSIDNIDLMNQSETMKPQRPKPHPGDVYQYLKLSEDEFTAGAPIQIVYMSLNETDMCQQGFNKTKEIILLCKSLPSMNSRFSSAYYDIFKTNTTKSILESSKMFKNDYVLTKTSFDTNVPLCNLIQHHRVYCAFESNRITSSVLKSVSKLNKHLSPNMFSFSVLYGFFNLTRSTICTFMTTAISSLVIMWILPSVQLSVIYHNAFVCLMWFLMSINNVLTVIAFLIIFRLKPNFINLSSIIVNMFIVCNWFSLAIMLQSTSESRSKKTNQNVPFLLYPTTSDIKSNQQQTVQNFFFDNVYKQMFNIGFSFIGFVIFIPFVDSYPIRSLFYSIFFIWLKSLIECLFLYPLFLRLFRIDTIGY